MTLIGYRTHWFKPDVLFKLYFRDAGVAGCRVGGQLLSAVRFNDPRQFARADLLERYPDDAHPPESYLALDRKNFWLPRELIAGIGVSSKSSFWAGYTTNSGSLRLRTREEGTWRFLLLGRQDAQAIGNALAGQGYPTD